MRNAVCIFTYRIFKTYIFIYYSLSSKREATFRNAWAYHHDCSKASEIIIRVPKTFSVQKCFKLC